MRELQTSLPHAGPARFDSPHPQPTSCISPSILFFLLPKQLHVFARLLPLSTGEDFVDVEVKDSSVSAAALKDAAIAKLRLDAAPSRVRLLLEVQGQEPSPLDSCKSLAEQAIVEGSRVLLQLPPATSEWSCVRGVLCRPAFHSFFHSSSLSLSLSPSLSFAPTCSYSLHRAAQEQAGHPL